MKKITFAAILLSFTIMSSNTFAQSQEQMQKWTEYMTPGPMHQMLAKANGTWNEDITMWMAPDAPPQKNTASCENKMIMDGRYQESIHKGSFNNMPFEGRSLVGYDNAKKVFVSSWVDNMGTGIMNMEGPYDAATKTVTFTGKMIDAMTGKDTDIKETFQFVDDNTQIMQMYTTQDGKEFKTMEIKFTRK